jgi:hypothetical protein
VALLDRIAEARAPEVSRAFSWPYPPSDTYGSFVYGGQLYFGTVSGGMVNTDREPPKGGYTAFAEVFRSNAIVYACELKRVSVFSEARFLWRGYNKGRPGNLWSDDSLQILETPWPRATTSDLLAEMLMSADVGGAAFVQRPNDGAGDRLRVLRPDWVTIVMGDSSGTPVESPSQLDAEIIGYIYDPKDGRTDAEALLVDEVAHWVPPGHRDPLARFRGKSWLSALVREVQADVAATMHKLSFFQNGGTPQLVIAFNDPNVTADNFDKFVQRMDERHSGWQNAYKTLYLGSGADVNVVGARDLHQLDFANTQGRDETRITAAAGLHPVLVPVMEALAGSALNAGNFESARRSVADMLFRPLWRSVCGALQTIVPSPTSSSELWYDEAYIPFLKEDAQVAAEIVSIKAATIANLVKEGFTPESAVKAVETQDVTLLEHTGLVSVQLLPPPTEIPQPGVPPVVPAAPVPAVNGRPPVPTPPARG